MLESIDPADKKFFYTSLYRTYYPVMAHTAFRVTNGGVNIEDIVQEALVRLLCQYDRLRTKNAAALACYITLTGKTDNVLDCGSLRLRAGEYITDIKFEFDTVQPGFKKVTAPFLLCTVNGDLPNEYRFANKCDVGGKRSKEWITAKDSWITVVFAKPKGKLPQTGF